MGLSERIERVTAWEVLDSRGTPTVAALVRLGGGAEGYAAVPSGASTGGHEAHERRDGGERHGGRGVRETARSVAREISPALTGVDARDQATVDDALRGLDGTPDLSRLGANVVLAVSVASALAGANARHLPLWRALAPEEPPLLPLPMVNVVSGGAHAGRLVDLQDVLVVPIGAESFAQALEWAGRVRAATAGAFRDRGFDPSLVADEGGLAAPLGSNREAVGVVVEGIARSGLEPGADVAIAIDVAATQLTAGDGYELAAEGRTLSAAELVDELVAWVDAYPIVSVEDCLGEDDLEGWALATERLGHRVQLLGDDLLATSPDRLAAAVASGTANAVLVKPNQVGTLTDARTVVDIARRAGYATVVSARSGDTEDTWLADLAVGWRTGQIKVGSTMRAERTAKWNRLLRIEAEETGAVFAGSRRDRAA